MWRRHRSRVACATPPDVPSVVLVVPGRLHTRTGGFIYDRQMAVGLRALGWAVDVRELDDSFPHPTTAALQHAASTFASLPANAITMVDGLALSTMPEVIEHAAARLRIVALVHQPLAAAGNTDPVAATRIERAERRALQAASLVVVTGAATRGLLEGYGLAAETVVLVEPGTVRPRAMRTVPPGGRQERRVGPLQLLSVGTISGDKGHEILLRALARVPDQEWRLTCAGSVTRDPETASRVLETTARLGLNTRVTFAGDLDAEALAACYARADIFVLPTLGETYGMAVAEALAHGLPVVSTATGAIPELVGDAGGLIVAPGDEDALADALSRVLGDPALRLQLAEGAQRAGGRLPTWEQASAKMAAALESLDADD